MLSRFFSSLAKLEGVSVSIAVKVPAVFSEQKIGVTMQTGTESVVVSPKKYTKSLKLKAEQSINF